MLHAVTCSVFPFTIFSSLLNPAFDDATLVYFTKAVIWSFCSSTQSFSQYIYNMKGCITDRYKFSKSRLYCSSLGQSIEGAVTGCSVYAKNIHIVGITASYLLFIALL